MTDSKGFSRHLSRRTFVRSSAVAGFGLASAAAVGCGDDDDVDDGDGQPQATSTPVPAESIDLDGTIRAGIKQDVGSLDPQSVAGVGGLANVWNHQIWPIAFHPQSRQATGLVADWKWTENNTVLEMVMKPRITFHNGEPLNAEAIKFNIDRVSGRAAYNTAFASPRKAQFASIGAVKVVTETTVRMEMAKPDVGLPGVFPTLYLVPPKYVAEQGDDALSRSGIGGGQFKLLSRTPDTDLKSERFDAFFNNREAALAPRLPYAKSLIQVVRPEDQARAAALEAGEIDVAADLDPDTVKAFAGKSGYKVFYPPATNGVMVGFNTRTETDAQGKPNPFRDIRVRKAINMAVDVDTIIKTILTGKERPNAGFGHSLFGRPDNLSDLRFKYDPAQAKALLSEAGYADGFTTQLYASSGRFPTTEVAMPAVVGYLEKVGIKAELKITPFAQFLPEFIKFSIPGMWAFATYQGPEPNAGFNSSFRSTGQYAVSKYDDQGFDQLLARQDTEFDSATRAKTIGEFMTKWVQNASSLFLWDTVYPVVTRENIAYEPSGLPLLSPEFFAMKVLKKS